MCQSVRLVHDIISVYLLAYFIEDSHLENEHGESFRGYERFGRIF